MTTGTRPATIPSLDNWTDAAGAWTLGEGARVVAPSALSERAVSLAQELTQLTGVAVTSATDVAPTSKDIVLTLDASRKATLGDEGFTLQIGNAGFTVTGATDIGVFYGTRSVSQMLRQKQLTLKAGTVTSVPKYEERGVTLCACQINISTDWIDRFLADMADNRLNYLLMEMKVKPEEPNTEKAATWSYYTRDDVEKFVAKAKDYGIDVIPEINSPGHMNIWLENYPEYQLKDKNGVPAADRLDITNPDAVQFYKTLIDEYDGVFDTDYWHMGADEYMIGSGYANYPQIQRYATEKYGEGATPNDAFTAFINEINDYVKAKGKTLRIWNDGIVPTSKVTLDDDVIVEYWAGGAGRVQPNDLIAQGKPVMNAAQNLYWSRSARFYNVNSQSLYNNRDWNIGKFDGGGTVDPDSPLLRGAKVSIWPDRSDLQTENEVEEQIFDGIRFIAQMTWSASRPWADWTGMKEAIDSIGYPLAVRDYDYQPLAEGTYDIPELESVAAGPWRLISTPDGYYQLKNLGLGTCLALDSGVGEGLVQQHLNVVTQVGAKPALRDCVDASVTWRNTVFNTAAGQKVASDRNTQKWQVRADKDGKFTLSPALTQQRLAVATGNEQHVDLDQMRALDPNLAPQAGEVAQFPADLVGDNALFTFAGVFDVSADASSTEVNPEKPAFVQVVVRADDRADSGPVTVTPVVPEGWKVLPEKVDLQSIPAGETAVANFTVVNTTGEGAATIRFNASTEAGTTRGVDLNLTGSLTVPLEVSDVAASSEEKTGEPAPNGVVGSAFDGNPSTYWHSKWQGGEDRPPHSLRFKATVADGERLAALTVLPRQDKRNGTVRDYKVYVVSAAGVTDPATIVWGDAVVAGELPFSGDLQTINLPETIPAGDVYVKFEATRMYSTNANDPENGTPANFASVAELAAVREAVPVEVTAPDQPTDNPVAKPKPTEPVDPTDPTDPDGPTGPVDPTDPGQPGGGTQQPGKTVQPDGGNADASGGKGKASGTVKQLSKTGSSVVPLVAVAVALMVTAAGAAVVSRCRGLGR